MNDTTRWEKAMDMNPQQRRALLALICTIALADGVVTDEERTFVHDFVER